MNMYVATVRYWPEDGKGVKSMRERKIILEAESVDAAMDEAKEIAMAKIWFGQDASRCETQMAARISFPYVL